MLSTNSLSIRNENVGEAVRKLAPRDSAKLNGIRLSSDFLSESLGLSAVKKNNFFGIFGGELCSRGNSRDRDQRRRRVIAIGMRIVGVFVVVHIGDTFDCPATVAIEASDLTPQIRIEREQGFGFGFVGVVVRGFEFEREGFL